MARLGRALPGFIWTRGPIALGQSWTTFQGAAVLGMTATLVAAGADIQPATAPTLSVTATVTAAATGVPQGAVAMSVAASMTADATVVKPSAATLSPVVTMTSAATDVRPGAVAMTVAASMTTAATETEFAAVAMTPAVTMTVSQATALQGAASLGVVASVVAGATQNFAVAALMTPSGSMIVSATRGVAAAAEMDVTASLSATGLRTVLAVVAITPAVTMSVSSAAVSLANIAMMMTATLTTQAKQTQLAASVMQPTFSVTITGFNATTSVPMTVTATVTARATVGIGVSQRQTYYLRQRQNWAIEQEQQRHAQALYTLGEMACFILMWHEIDFQRGLVGRCTTCYATADPLLNRVTNVYNQPTRNKCPDCFGTTFEGGFRARIVRPVIITDTDETEKPDRRGAVHTDDMEVESTWDFRSRNGDFLLRADGSRWRLGAPQRTTLRTGFAHPSQLATAIAYSAMRASYEEEGTVAYLLPPTDPEQLQAVLTTPALWPPDFSAFEIERADLIPASLQD